MRKMSEKGDGINFLHADIRSPERMNLRHARKHSDVCLKIPYGFVIMIDFFPKKIYNINRMV